MYWPPQGSVASAGSLAGTVGVASGGTGLTTYTAGDLLTATGSTTLAKLAIGAVNLILNSTGSAPQWSTLSALLDAAIGSTRGSVLYRGNSGWAILTPGTATYPLVSGGAGADPAYASPSTILDVVGSTRGAVLYRGASSWAVLAPGTSGHFLKSNGTGADPSYAGAPAPTTAFACDINRTTTLAVNNTTFTPVTFDAETYDTGSLHSTSSNTARITIPAGGAGIYALAATVTWPGGGSNFRSVYWARYNSSDANQEYFGQDVAIASSSGGWAGSAWALLKAAQGDYFQVELFHNNGSGLTVQAGARAVAALISLT